MVASTARADDRLLGGLGAADAREQAKPNGETNTSFEPPVKCSCDFGFDGASMAAVAAAARISKRTLYAHHADKAALFSAVVSDLVSRWLVRVDRFETEQDDLEEILLALARRLTTSALTPEAVSVNRVIISESLRRPEFGRLADDAGRKPAVAAIASILSRRRSELRLTDYEMAADQFLNLAVDSGLRLANFGLKLTPDEMEQRVRASVDLFLFGARRRDLSETDCKA